MNPELLSSSPDSPMYTAAPSTLASPRSPTAAPPQPPFGAQALAGAHAAFPSRTVVRENPLFHMDDDIIVFGGGGGGGEIENGANVDKNGGKFVDVVGAFSSWVSGLWEHPFCTLFYLHGYMYTGLGQYG